MNRKNVTFLLLSCIVAVIWIVYTVYSNLTAVDYTTQENIPVSLSPISTNLHLETLKKVNALGANIKVSNQSLQPSSTPTPTPGS